MLYKFHMGSIYFMSMFYVFLKIGLNIHVWLGASEIMRDQMKEDSKKI